MSCPTTSLVSVSKHDAFRAAQAMMAAAPGVIAAAREETIVRVMLEERRWFGRRLNRAEAERVVDSTATGAMGFPNHYSWWRVRDSRLKTFAQHLTRAASLSQDECVWLNLDDADTVFGWLQP